MKVSLLTIPFLYGLFAIASEFSVFAPTSASRPEWPQWRGPRRDGKSDETGLLKSWPKNGPQVLWRLPLGKGFSGISVSAGSAYTMFDDGEDEYLVCLDAESGRHKWQKRTDRNYVNSWGDGPRVTPLIEGGRVYTISAYARLYACAATTGAVVWQRDLAADFGGTLPDLGYSNSPLIDGNVLLVTGLGARNRSVLAFDKASGQLVWSSHDDHPGYSSPIVFSIRGLRQALFFTGTGIASVSPHDGTVLWTYPWRTDSYENVATPVFIPEDKLFFSSAHPQEAGSAVLQVKESGSRLSVNVVWKSSVLQHHFSSSVLSGEHLYGTDRSILKCVDVRTGEEKWNRRGFGEGSLIYADGHLLVLGTSGNLALVEATPRAYREKASAQALSGRCFTSPSLANGRLYLRNATEMICLDLTGQRSINSALQ